MMLKGKTKLKAACFPPTSRAFAMLNDARGDYQSISVMDSRIVPGSKFFVEVAGNTKEAHKKIVSNIEKCGCVQVSFPEDSDFLLIFCPVVSRVGTDIGEALQNVTQFNKPKVLVVMHHTFNPRMVVAESRRQVEDRNVVLTVDCLFHEGKLLTCDRNDIAWDQICRGLGISNAQLPFWETFKHYICTKKVLFLCGILIFTAFSIVIIYYFADKQEPKKNMSSEYSLK